MRKYILLAIAALVVLLGSAMAYYTLFSSIIREAGVFINVDQDDTADSVVADYALAVHGSHLWAFQTVASVLKYPEHVRTGHYEIRPGEGVLSLVRKLRSGMQSPIRLVVPSVRTPERLAAELGEKLMIDSATIINALKDSATCMAYGLDTANIIGMFIPNTHEIYWNISVDKLLNRMQKESDRFWTSERRKKAEKTGLTPQQVITLASVIDEETANNAEKPMIAGMYLNRLKVDMPLQADPTIKFALRQFGLRRIYHDLLTVDSPYNTYRNTGLPPGPIRIPSAAGIDAVLNAVSHDYLYMCAKEDFSGSHNFARTYSEHLQNARKYSAALNARGIR